MALLAPASVPGIEERQRMSRKALLAVTTVRGSDFGAPCPDGPGWSQAQEGDLDKFEESTLRHEDLSGVEHGVGFYFLGSKDRTAMVSPQSSSSLTFPRNLSRWIFFFLETFSSFAFWDPASPGSSSAFLVTSSQPSLLILPRLSGY